MMKPKFPFLCQVMYQKGNGQKPAALRLMVDFFFPPGRLYAAGTDYPEEQPNACCWRLSRC